MVLARICFLHSLRVELLCSTRLVFNTSMDRVAEDGTMTFPTIKAVRRALG